MNRRRRPVSRSLPRDTDSLTFASANRVSGGGTTTGLRSSGSVRARVAGLVEFVIVIAVTGAIVVAIILARSDAFVTPQTTIAMAGAIADLSPTELTTAAADFLDAATAKGGVGYTFEIVQLSSLNQQPGGPLIDIPDPVNRGGSLGKTDHYELATFIERGAVAPGGFWLEIRDGPTKDAKPDFETATYELGTIVRDGLTYRDDGEGWYETKNPPGIGLDPATAALLPTMLRGTTERKDVDTTPADGSQVARTLEATTNVADLPGFIAVDGAPFTAFTGPLELGFDEGGRLVSIHGIARNTNLKAFDLLVDTTMTFTYPTSPPDIPKPDPIIKTDTIKVEG